MRELRGGDEQRPEAWATRQEVADHFRASLRVVHRWVGDGMPSATIAGRRLFKLSACEEWPHWTGVIEDERLRAIATSRRRKHAERAYGRFTDDE